MCTWETFLGLPRAKPELNIFRCKTGPHILCSTNWTTIDSSQGINVTHNRINVQFLIKRYSINIVLYAITKNQDAREIAEAFYNNDCGWVDLKCTYDAAGNIGY